MGVITYPNCDYSSSTLVKAAPATITSYQACYPQWGPGIHGFSGQSNFAANDIYWILIFIFVLCLSCLLWQEQDLKIETEFDILNCEWIVRLQLFRSSAYPILQPKTFSIIMDDICSCSLMSTSLLFYCNIHCLTFRMPTPYITPPVVHNTHFELKHLTPLGIGWRHPKWPAKSHDTSSVKLTYL